jgi:ABC-type branched-subunit amino acid transport system substrate-binding protein
MVFEDNRYNAQAALAAFRTLVSLRGVDLLFSWGEVPLHPVAPLAERIGMPVVAMSVDARPAEGREWVVVGVNPVQQFVAQLWGVLRQRGARRVGVLVSDDPFMLALFEELQRGAAAGEVVELVGSIAPAEQDLRALAARVARASYDALGVLLISGQIGTFYRELHKLKFSGFTFGTDCFESATEVASAGEGINGAVYVSPEVPDDFRSRYKQRVGTLSQVGWAYHAYLTTVWLRTILPESCPSDRREILRLFEAAPLPAGVQRYRSPRGVRHTVFPLSPKRVAAGSFVRLSP